MKQKQSREREREEREDKENRDIRRWTGYTSLWIAHCLSATRQCQQMSLHNCHNTKNKTQFSVDLEGLVKGFENRSGSLKLGLIP